MTPIALTIAGSDPSGGAGIQADLKTFHQRGVYGMSVLTLLTVQNTRRVAAVECLDADFVLHQLDAVLYDIPPHAAKTGALGNSEIIRALAHRAGRFDFPLVVDPVMISKHGDSLIEPDARAALMSKLLPHAALVTPNLHEARRLANMERVESLSDAREAARAIAGLGARAVVIKGVRVESAHVDLLYHEGTFDEVASPHIETTNTHGTGCAYSAAITAELAKGQSLPIAVRAAKKFITRAIETNPNLGGGIGPVNLHAEV